MQKLVIGKSNALTKKETLYIVEFFAKAILGERLTNKVHIQIRFKDYRDGSWGYSTVLDMNRKLHREFEIAINPNLSKKNQIITLAHEIKHVQQFAHGHLTSTNRAYKWMGREVPFKEGQDYTDNNLPWEKEAIAVEQKMYRKYRQHVGDNNLTF